MKKRKRRELETSNGDLPKTLDAVESVIGKKVRFEQDGNKYIVSFKATDTESDKINRIIREGRKVKW